MKCQSCGATITEWQAYCTQCGAPVTRNSPPTLEGKGNYPVPQGFIKDPDSGLYYTSEMISYRDTGKVVQRVTYFNKETGVIQPVDYPLNNAMQIHPVKQRKKQSEKQAGVGIIAVLGVVLLTTCMVAAIYLVSLSFSSGKEKAKPPSFQESWKEHQEGDGEEEDSKESEKKPREEQIKIRPYGMESGILGYSGLADSTYIGSTYEDEKYYYFLSPERKFKELEIEAKKDTPDDSSPEISPPPPPEDWGVPDGGISFLAEEGEDSQLPEGFSPPLPEEFFTENTDQEKVLIRDRQGNAVYRMTKSTGEVDVLVTAKEGTILHDFVIIGDQFFYQCGGVAETGEPDFTYYEVWAVNMSTGESRFLTHSTDSPLSSAKGYLYMVNHKDGLIYQYGLGEESGKDASRVTEYTFGKDTSLHLSNFSLYNDRTVLPIYDYKENRQLTYLYNLESGEKELVFRGQRDCLYRNTFVTPKSLFSVKFNGRTDELQTISLGYTPREFVDASEDFYLLSEKTQVQWYDKGIFLHIREDTIYYEKEGMLASAPLENPTDFTLLIPLEAEVSSVVGDLLIFENNTTYNLSTKEQAEYAPMNRDTPLLEKEIVFGRNPQRRERGKFPQEDTDYYDYAGEVAFPRGSDSIMRLLGNGIPYMNLAAGTTWDTHLDRLPLLYGMLRSGNLMGGINPDGTLNMVEIGRFYFDVFEDALSPKEVKGILSESSYFTMLDSGALMLNMEIHPVKMLTGIEVHKLEEESDGFVVSQIALYYREHPVEIYVITGEVNTDPILSEYFITSITFVDTIKP